MIQVEGYLVMLNKLVKFHQWAEHLATQDFVMYTDDIQAPVKAIFNKLKKDYPTVPQTMFQHNSGVGDSSEGNTSVLGSIQRKLFLDAVNIELDRAVWGLHTIFDAVFKPFASKQQVPLATSLPALFILIVERP